MSTQLKKWSGVLLKLGVTAVFVWLIATSIDLTAAWNRLSGVKPALVVPAVLGMLFQLGINAERWRRLGRLCGARLTYRQSIRYYLESMFFNQALPSTVGGDALRVYRLRQDGNRLTISAQSVLLDRLAGLLGLLVLILVAQPLFHRMVDDVTARVIFAAIIAAGIGGYVMLFGLHWLPAALRGNRVISGIGGLGSYVRHLILTPSDGIPILLISVGGHLVMVASTWGMAYSLGIEVGFVTCFVMVPAAILASMVPITIAGWGVREGAMVAAFSLIGMASSDTVAWSILFGLIWVFIGLIGGVVWFVGGGRVPVQETGRGE